MEEDQFNGMIEYTGYVQNTDPEHPFFGVTVCFLRLVNGFVATGESKCFNVEEFDDEAERQHAYDQALLQLMGHMEFASRLSGLPQDDGPDAVEKAAEEVDPVYLDLSSIASGVLH